MLPDIREEVVKVAIAATVARDITEPLVCAEHISPTSPGQGTSTGLAPLQGLHSDRVISISIRDVE
jgi:hypothetical protein